MLNGYTIVFAAVLVPAGRWADRVGRRRLFVAGLIAFTIGSLLCGLAPGVAGADRRPGHPGGRGGPDGAGLAVAAAGRGPGAGPGAGDRHLVGARRARRGARAGDRRRAWSRSAGAGCSGSTCRSAWSPSLLAARVVPGEQGRARSAGGRTWLGAGLLAAAVGLLAFALVKAPDWGWGSARFVGLLLAAVACGAAMVVRSRRHHSPVIELGLLRSRTFSGTFAASILYYAGFGAFVLNSVEFLTGEWHYSAVRAGLAIGPGPLMVLPFARLVAPRLAARLGGPGRVAVLGCLVNAGVAGAVADARCRPTRPT